MKRLSFISLFFCIFFCLPLPASGDVYFYRDENNALHFTDTPPNASYKLFFPKKHRKVRKSYQSGKSVRNHPGIADHIKKTAQGFQLDPRLVHAIIQAESDFDPDAISSAGALGLMQLMPETAKELGVADPMDPFQNIAGGTRYFRQMLDAFNGNAKLALAAYNAGMEPVKVYGGVPPFPETQKYVKKVLSTYKKPGTVKTAKKPKNQGRIYRVVQEDGTLLLTDRPH